MKVPIVPPTSSAGRQRTRSRQRTSAITAPTAKISKPGSENCAYRSLALRISR
jgi:hypothetical protein